MMEFVYPVLIIIVQLFDFKMRHTIAIRASNKIKNGELAYHFPSVQDGECVKLSQNGKHIYLVYRLTESMGLKQAEVNQHILLLNGLESDCSTSVQQFNPRVAEHLRVEVSELDWKIININQAKIAESFLEQISVVWPNSQVPIYYDQINFVVLKALCENVVRLNINTTVQFIEKKEAKDENQQQQQEQQPLKSELVLTNVCQNVKNGYFNSIYISPSLKQKFKYLQQYWIVQNTLQFSQTPTINELLKLQQQRTKKDQSYVPSSNKRLVNLCSEVSVKQNEYSCSKQCLKLLGISQKIHLSDDEHFKPSFQVLSLDIFLNDPNLSLSINQLKQDISNLPASVEQQLAQHIVDTLMDKKQFYVLQQEYPYLYKQSLYIFTITHKTNAKLKDKLHKLAFIGKQSAGKRQEYYNKLVNKINYRSERNKDTSPAYLHQKYELIARWIKVIQQNKIAFNVEGDQQVNSSLENVFSITYADQINKVLHFISNDSSQKVCVVCSYGSNGKSYLHNFLQKKGHRMWKVNFRQLNNPSLSFKEIDFYLEWIFANTPYSTLYFDDFDSLCAKIDEGDQLRKQEKRISKLILRKINSFTKIYNRKLILTAKNDTNLDQELPKHTTITLKNPSRELRLKALVQISKKQGVDSPIKQVSFDEQKMQAEKDLKFSTKKLNQIVDATESLTFGAFMKHASAFTKPKHIVSTQVYDFSKIAGLKIAKSTIQNIIEKPIKYAFLFKSVPIKLPRGILLYGATGNGKSALGLAVKDQFKMKYFSVKGSDILSKYIGGSEAAVRDIFQKALSVSPSIIFFDEFQSIVPKRSANNTGVNDRIVNQFLCYLDGVSAISGVYIIAASSRPDLIDAAVLRPGRLDAHLFLDYPQPDERKELIELFRKSINIDADQEQIIEKTENYSYSDLIGLFKELRIKRSAEVLKNQNYKSEDFIKIGRQLFEQTLKNFKLSVTPQQQKRQRKNYINFKEGVGPDMKTQKQVQF